jgi:hypothetical protein
VFVSLQSCFFLIEQSAASKRESLHEDKNECHHLGPACYSIVEERNSTLEGLSDLTSRCSKAFRPMNAVRTRPHLLTVSSRSCREPNDDGLLRRALYSARLHVLYSIMCPVTSSNVQRQDLVWCLNSLVHTGRDILFLAHSLGASSSYRLSLKIDAIQYSLIMNASLQPDLLPKRED